MKLSLKLLDIFFVFCLIVTIWITFNCHSKFKSLLNMYTKNYYLVARCFVLAYLL